MTFVHNIISEYRRWGFPESVLTVPVTVAGSPDGALHALSGCNAWTGMSGPTWQIDLTQVDEAQLCVCMRDIAPRDVPSQHWKVLNSIRVLAEDLERDSTGVDPAPRSTYLHRLRKEAHALPDTLGYLFVSGPAMEEFVRSLQEKADAATRTFHDALVAWMPEWCTSQDMDLATVLAGPWSLVGIRQASVWEHASFNQHLVLAAFSDKESFLRMNLTGRDTLVLRLPMPVAECLWVFLPEAWGVEEEMVPSSAEDTPEVLETLRVLWDPNSSGSMSSFPDAVSAARNV